MTLIEPTVEIISEPDVYKKIEMAGRTCYKSEPSLTSEYALKFVKNLCWNNHTAMLEHATLCFRLYNDHLYELCMENKFLNCTVLNEVYYVSGNIRALNESGIYALLDCMWQYDKNLVYTKTFSPLPTYDGGAVELIDYMDVINSNMKDLIPNIDLRHFYTTMKFVCDRGVTHELVRHRLFSFAQESTRYVNYTKEKFGEGHIKFIKPANFEKWNGATQEFFQNSLSAAENDYNCLIKFCHLTPQQARAVLPNAVKTEIIVTGNYNEWRHFFNLRSDGTTGAPHPDMKVVADMAKDLYYSQYPFIEELEQK